MPNTNLRTNLTPGATGNIADRNTVHTEINRLSRDTGWRVLPLRAGWTLDAGGFAEIRRVDDEVTIRLCGLNGSAATDTAFASLGSAGPDGNFRGIDPLRSPVFALNAGNDIADLFHVRVASSQLRLSKVLSIPASVAYEWTFKTDRVWPSALGTAA